MLVLRWRNETIRNSRGVGSPSENCGPAFRAREIVDGSGRCRWIECFVRQSLEESLASSWRMWFSPEATCWSTAQTVACTATATGLSVGSGAGSLGIRATRLDMRVSPASDSTDVWGRVPRGLCRNAATPLRVEPTKAATARSGAQRRRDRAMAPRDLARDKKRGPSETLAWFFSMKAASCCSHFVAASGHGEERRRCTTRGRGTTAFRHWVRWFERRGRNDSISTASCSTTTSGQTMSYSSCAKFTAACVIRLSSSATAGPRIGLLHDNSNKRDRRGSVSNGCRHTHRSSTPWSTCGRSRNTATLLTLFPMTFRNFAKPLLDWLTSIVTTHSDFGPSFAQLTCSTKLRCTIPLIA